MTYMIFIPLSGRSGSAAIARALQNVPGIYAHHQYDCTSVQHAGTSHFMAPGHYGTKYVRHYMHDIYYAAKDHCPAEFFVDVSNKLSWVIPELSTMFWPRAKFALVIRDGRAVVSSYYHKLPLIYSKFYVDKLQWWFDPMKTEPLLHLPPDENYWWPLPPHASELSRFELLCWYWVTNNRTAMEAMRGINQPHFYRLESMIKHPEIVKDFVDTLGLPKPEKTASFLRAQFKRPHNVIRPVSYQLTPEQNEIFWGFPGVQELMDEFGYDKDDDYGVNYG